MDTPITTIEEKLAHMKQLIDKVNTGIATDDEALTVEQYLNFVDALVKTFEDSVHEVAAQE